MPLLSFRPIGLVLLAMLINACADDASPPASAATTEAGERPDDSVATTAVVDASSSVLPGVAPAGVRTGLSVRTADGRDRSAVVYVPASLPTNGLAPLLVGLHGGTGSGEQFEASSGFDRLAEANGFLAVYPDGIGALKTWNGGVCCGRAVEVDVDDVSFVRQLVTELAETYSLDPARVFATGHSNGMIMAYRLLCDAADVVVAAAGQAGVLGVDGCQPSAPVSLLHVHGAADTNLPIDGGGGEGLAGVEFPSPREGIRAVAAAAGCPAEPATSTDGPVTTETWEPCDGATTVEFVTVAGADHGWMGSSSSFRPGGPEPFQDYDASLASWSFLADHPRT